MSFVQQKKKHTPRAWKGGQVGGEGKGDRFWGPGGRGVVITTTAPGIDRPA